MAEQKPAEFVRAGEVARLFHVSPKTVARWSKEGKLPHVLTLGGHRRYSVKELQAVVARTRGEAS